MTEEPSPSTTSPGSSRLDLLLLRTKQLFGQVLAEWIKQPISEVGLWLKRRILQFSLGLVLLCVAIVFLLIGGVQALREVHIPSWATYLGVGGIAALLGVLLLRRGS